MEITQRVIKRLKQASDWNGIIDELESDADGLDDAAEQSRALYELASVCEQLLLDKARAMKCYQKAFKLDQGNLQALSHAREIYREMAHLDMVVRLMGMELKRNEDPLRDAELNYAFGNANLNLRQFDQAKSYLEAAANGDPSNPDYVARVSETRYTRGEWETELELVFEELTAATGCDDPVTADVVGKGSELGGMYLRAARILQQEAEEDSRLLPLLFKALDADPKNTEAAFIAETMLAKAGLLQHIQKLQDRRASLIEDVSERIQVYHEAAMTWSVRLNNEEMAAYFFRQALELSYSDRSPNGVFPGHLAAFRLIRSQPTAGKDASGLVSLAERGIAKISSEDERSVLAIEAAEIAYRSASDLETARRLLRQAGAPSHPFVAEFEADYGPVTDTDQVSASDADAGDAAVAAGEAVSEDVSEQLTPEQAAPTSEPSEDGVASEGQSVAHAVVDDDDEDDAAHAVGADEEPAAETAVAQQASASAESESSAAAEAAVNDAEVEAGDIDGESYTAAEMAIIEKARGAADAGGKRAIDAWREALHKLPGRKYPRAQLQALYVEAGKWSNVADLIKDERKRSDDVSHRIALTWELVDIYRERLSQPGLVVTTLGDLENEVEKTGDNAELRRVVESQRDQFEQMKRWPDLIGRIKKLAELSEDVEQRVELNLEAGTLFLDKFSNQAEAIRRFESVLEDEPHNAVALERLDQIYSKRREWEKLVAVRQKALETLDDADLRREKQLEIARTVGAKIKKPSLSIQVWNDVLDNDPGNVEALGHLEQMYERAKDWENLVHTLRALIESDENPEKKPAQLVKLGTVLSDKLRDNHGAIEAWRQLHQLDPNNRRALDALKKLYLAEGDMEALEDFYAGQNKWAEFIRVLEREYESTHDGDRTELLLKIAALYTERLEKPDRAIRALEKGLAADGDNLAIAEALLERYRETNDERKMLSPLEIKLRHARDPLERLELLRQLADLSERINRDFSSAFEYLRKAVEERHSDGELSNDLRRLAGQAGKWPEFVREIEAVCDDLGLVPETIEMRLDVARAYEEEIRDAEKAHESYRNVLEIDAQRPEALDALERLYADSGRERELLDILSARLGLVESDEDARDVHARMGAIHQRLGDDEQAIESYIKVLDLGGESRDALAALDALYTAGARQQELSDIIQREIDLARSEGADAAMIAGFEYRLGQLALDELGDAPRAVELFSSVLAVDESNEGARVRLEALLDDENLAPEVSAVLLPIYERSGDSAAIVRCLETRLAVVTEPSERISLLTRMGEISSAGLGDPDASFALYERALHEDPTNEEVRATLEQCAERGNKWEALAATYEKVLDERSEGSLAKALLARLAVVYGQNLGRVDRAIAALQRSVELDPDDRPALDALLELYRSEGRWEDVLGVLRQRVALAEAPEDREAIRFEIAELLEHRLDNVDGAIETYNDIVADAPDHRVALASLARLHAERENWAELGGVLEWQIEHAESDAERVEQNLRLGELHTARLDRPGAAIEAYQRVLELDPNNTAARDALVALLDNPDHQLEVAQLLEGIYRVSADLPRLAEVSEILVKHAVDPAEKVRLLHEIANLHEQMGEAPEKAFAAAGRAFETDPAHEESRERVGRLAREQGRVSELVAIYGRATTDLVDEELKATLLREMAQIHETELGDADGAASCYEQILEIRPDDFEAIDALIDLRRATNQFEQLVDAVCRKADMVGDDDARKQLLDYAAQVREGVLEDPKGAIELHRQVLAIDDSELGSLQALERLHLQLNDWEALEEVYSRMCELAEDPESRVSYLKVLAQVYDRELGNTDKAIETYESIREAVPADFEAIQALDRLYGAADRGLEQLQILETAAGMAEREEEATELRFRVANLWESRLGDTGRAVEAYRELLAHDPTHAPTIQALHNMARGDAEPMTAARVLEPYYTDAGDWDKLIELYEVMVEHTPEVSAKIERLHAIADICVTQLEDRDRAFGAFSRALELDPTDERTLVSLDELAESTGQWRALADLLARLADNVLDMTTKVAMLAKIADIEHARLGDVEAAIVSYRALLDTDPQHEGALTALDEIYSALARWDELVENLQRRISMTDGEDELVALQFRLGQVYHHNLQRLPEAIDAYREILNIQPEYENAVSELEEIFETRQYELEIAEILQPIYHASGRWEQMVRLGKVRVSATDDVAERIGVIQGVADICELKMNNPKEAFFWWLRAYIEEPTNDMVCEQVDRLAEDTGLWEHIVEVGNQVLDAEGEVSPAVQLAVLSRSAQTLDARLAQPERAAAAYRQILAIDGSQVDAIEALDRIYQSTEEWSALVEILQLRIRNEMAADVIVDLELRLAHVLDERLGRADAAIEAFHRALDQDPGNMRALEALEALYFKHHEWEALFRTYQSMADVAKTDEDGASCAQRMAKIASDVLARPEEAIELWNRVLDLRGEDAVALTELAILYRDAERWDDVVNVTERLIYVEEMPERKLEAYQWLGEIHEHQGDTTQARDAWLNARELNPEDPLTLTNLAAIYFREESWVEYVESASKLAQLRSLVDERDPELRELYVSIARVQTEHLYATDDAIESWQQVLEVAPGDPEALEALQSLYENDGRWEEAIVMLEHVLQLTAEPDARAPIMLRIANIQYHELGDAARSVPNYQAVLEGDPSNAEAGDALESIYRATGEWSELASVLLSRAEAAEDAHTQIEYCQRIAEIYERELGDAEAAFDVLKGAFNIDYAHEGVSKELERIATKTGKWDQLLAEYDGIVHKIEEPHDRCDLLVRIGHWYGEHLNRADLGVDALSRALELNPESVPALRELASFYRREGEHGELANVLAEIVPLEQDVDAQVGLLFDLAQVRDEGLAQPAEAVDAYRRILELDGENVKALDALARLHESREEWSDLVSVLARRAAVCEDQGDLLGFKRKIGQIQEEQLNDQTAAIWTFKDVIATEPSDGFALAALERLYLSRGNIDDYLDTLDAQLDAAVETEEQIAIYTKIADALIRHSDDELRAAEVLEKIIILDPTREETYGELERIYTQHERWSEAIDTYRSHVQNCNDQPARIELLRAMGQLFEHQIQDIDRAADIYREILELDPGDFKAALELSKLQETNEDWYGAVETLAQLVELTEAPAERVELLTRLGRVYNRQLGDIDSAEQRLNDALSLDPAHVPGMMELADIYRRRADWLKAARVLQMASDCSNNDLERAELAAEAGFICLEELEDEDRAIEVLSSVLDIDPEQVRVGRVLAGLHFKRENYEAADPILEMLSRKAASLDLDDYQLRDLYVQSAVAAREVGDTARALKQYRRAYDVDSSDHEVLHGMAELLYREQAWDQAFKHYQTLLIQHRDTQSEDATVAVYHRLASIKQAQGETRKALNYLEKALEIQPHHKESLDLMIELQGKAGDWDAVISAKRAMSEVASGDEQFKLLDEIGSIYRDQLGNHAKAAEYYSRALDLKPDDYPMLHGLLELHTKHEQWAQAVSVLERIVAIEEDAERRGRYNYTAAVLLRDNLSSPEESIDRFNMVLDDDPGMLKAFQAIDTMLTKVKDWKALERNYRKMLKRIPNDGERNLRVALWHNLGEIYRSRLGDFKAAAAAYDIAAKLDPDTIQRHIILAELYQRLLADDPEAFVDNAVREHQILIAREPFRTESYHALFSIYSNSNQIDKAYCVASVLVFLKQASREEETYHQKYKPAQFVHVRKRLSEEVLRRHVFHPDQDRYLTAILGTIAGALASWRAQAPKALSPDERVEVANDPSPLARMTKYVKDVLNVQEPDLYVKKDDVGDARVINVLRGREFRPTIVAYQGVANCKREDQLAFALGRYMSDVYPPHYAYVALDRSPQNLIQVVTACLRYCEVPVTGDLPKLEVIAKEVTGRLSQANTDQLRSLVQKFVQAGGSTDVKRWASAVELTSYRTGLLLCGDLSTAALMASHEQHQMGSMLSTKDKFKEMVLYSVSEDYFQARKALGLNVGN